MPCGRSAAAFLFAGSNALCALRERMWDAPYYRLVHAEADGLPGLVVDRFGPVLVVQSNAAGMARLEPLVLDALGEVLKPEAIVLRNDSPARALEGLPSETRVAKGAWRDRSACPKTALSSKPISSAGRRPAGSSTSATTGALSPALARGSRVLDLYCFSGGFALQAARAGAAAVLGIDRSEPALALAAEAAERNGVAAICSFRRAEAFTEAARLAAAGERFDIVIADPPAFARSRRDVPAALRGYRKLARLAASLTAAGGVLFLASCSFNVGAAEFAEAVRRGLGDAGRAGRILRVAGADADHPVHPALPETAYLKTMTLALD